MALILIVDDSTISRSLLRRIIQGLGHQTIEGTNGTEGLDMAINHQPDCIFLDILMPELRGIEVLEKLNERRENIPTIFVTADTQETTRTKCLELGAITVLNKPPKAEQIEVALAQALSQKDKG